MRECVYCPESANASVNDWPAACKSLSQHLDLLFVVYTRVMTTSVLAIVFAAIVILSTSVYAAVDVDKSQTTMTSVVTDVELLQLLYFGLWVATLYKLLGRGSPHCMIACDHGGWQVRATSVCM